jgi:hypothetical protein
MHCSIRWFGRHGGTRRLAVTAGPRSAASGNRGQPAGRSLGIHLPEHPKAGNTQDRNNQEGSIAMRLYDFGALILLAGIAAMVALVVASQVG